jgi:SAM-dependent methyltransferase
VATNRSDSDYVLGSTDGEHERLIWQAKALAPITERLFREAGIGVGQRVLDIGSGAGDVAMLVAELVGTTGEVIGVERDMRSIGRARARVADAGLRNLSFVQADVSDIRDSRPFDAAVGRFILMWVPDPAAVLKVLVKLVRPGGVLAFQEPDWDPVLALLEPLPLWSAAASLVSSTFARSGGDLNLGSALYSVFRQAGLPGPTMRQEIPMGRDPYTARWFPDILRVLLPEIQRLNISLDRVGDLDTLAERLQAEADASDRVVACFAPVGAWVRT